MKKQRVREVKELAWDHTAKWPSSLDFSYFSARTPEGVNLDDVNRNKECSTGLLCSS